MVASLLVELRRCSLDEEGRERLQHIYQSAVDEISSGLSPDLQNELERMRPHLDDGAASESELRVAHAQLVGWLEGLVHGMQAAVAAQQLADQSQLQRVPEQQAEQSPRPAGTYL